MNNNVNYYETPMFYKVIASSLGRMAGQCTANIIKAENDEEKMQAIYETFVLYGGFIRGLQTCLPLGHPLTSIMKKENLFLVDDNDKKGIRWGDFVETLQNLAEISQTVEN